MNPPLGPAVPTSVGLDRSFVLAILMVILGMMAATDLLVREGGPPGTDARFFYIVPLSGMMIFAALIFFAFRGRAKPPAHKRLTS